MSRPHDTDHHTYRHVAAVTQASGHLGEKDYLTTAKVFWGFHVSQTEICSSYSSVQQPTAHRQSRAMARSIAVLRHSFNDLSLSLSLPLLFTLRRTITWDIHTQEETVPVDSHAILGSHSNQHKCCYCQPCHHYSMKRKHEWTRWENL